MLGSALPILRQLGAQGGGSSLLASAREGDFSMLKVWVGLEARKFLKASVDDVSAPPLESLSLRPCGIGVWLIRRVAGRVVRQVRSAVSEYLSGPVSLRGNYSGFNGQSYCGRV